MKKIIDLKDVKFPSINHKFTGNFKLTLAYRYFKDLIILECKKRKIEKLNPPYRMTALVSMYQDYDNILKPIGDGLKIAGVIEDDRYMYDVHIMKNPIKRGQLGSIEIYLEEMLWVPVQK